MWEYTVAFLSAALDTLPTTSTRFLFSSERHLASNSSTTSENGKDTKALKEEYTMKEGARKRTLAPMLVDFSSHMTDKFLVVSSRPFSVLVSGPKLMRSIGNAELQHLNTSRQYQLSHLYTPTARGDFLQVNFQNCPNGNYLLYVLLGHRKLCAINSLHLCPRFFIFISCIFNTSNRTFLL